MFVRMVFKGFDIKKKKFLALFILMMFPAYFTYDFVTTSVVRDVNARYAEDFLYPGDIMVYYQPRFNLGESWVVSVFNVTRIVRSVEGVKWAYSPDKVTFWNLSYPASPFYNFRWCNISDPTFPKLEYVVEGEFFSSNDEDAVLLDRIAFLYFTRIGRISGIGDMLKLTYILYLENGSYLSASFQWRVKGIVSSPAMDAAAESIMNKENYRGNIILPIGTFQRFFQRIMEVFFFKNGSGYGFELFNIGMDIVVRVKPGYDVYDVAERIKKAVKERFYGEVYCFIKEAVFNRFRNQIAWNMIVFSLIAFSLIAAILFWDVRDKRRFISLLRVTGWRRRHVVSLFILRYSLIGFIGSWAGNLIILFYLALYISVSFFLFALVNYYVYVLLIYLGFTLLASIPALLRVYSLDLEKVLRR